MKIEHYGKYLLYLLPFLLQSCIETVDLNLQKTDSVNVLNCIITPARDTVTTWLTKSNSITSNNSFQSIDNATITLYEDGILVDSLTYNANGKYTLAYTVKHSKNYRLEATINDTTIWAKTTVPSEINATFGKEDDLGFSGNYVIYLTDAVNESNYYWITAIDSMSHGKPWGTAPITIYTNYQYADDFNQNIESEGLGYNFYYDYYIRFNDNQFSGEETKIMFYPNGSPSYSILISADKNLDSYMKSSYTLYLMAQYAEEMPMTYVPSPVYSNINGGTGIFGSYSLAYKNTREQP